MKKIISILYFMLMAFAGSAQLSTKITDAKNYNNANIVTNATKQITAVKVNTALDKILQAIDFVDTARRFQQLNLTGGAGINVSGTFPNINVSNIDSALISITKPQADTLIKYSQLKKGYFYKISGTHSSLYNDGTSSGTTLILMAVSNYKFSQIGWGVFYNPKYNQATAGFGIWNPYSTWTAGTMTGMFNAGELITANNGATGQLVGVPQTGFFIPLTGTWTSGVTSVTGNVTGATLTVSGIAIKSYTAASKTIWGGYSWTNLTGAVGTATNVTTLDGTNWLKNAYDTSNYNIAIDNVDYDYSNDFIVKRHEVQGNNTVVCTKNNLTGFSPSFHPIAVFQWGNAFASQKGMGNNWIDNSYCETIDFRGGYFYNNFIVGVSNFKNNILLGTTAVYDNRITAGNFQSNILAGASTVYLNTIEQTSAISTNSGATAVINQNRITGGGSIDNNLFYGAGNIIDNKMLGDASSNGTIISANKFLTSNCNISFNIMYAGTINNNILNKTSFSAASIISNSMYGNSAINSNNIFKSSINNNYLLVSNISFDSLNTGQIRYNSLIHSSMNLDTLINATAIDVSDIKLYTNTFSNKRITTTTQYVVVDNMSYARYPNIATTTTLPDYIMVMHGDTLMKILSSNVTTLNLGNNDLTNISSGTRYYDNNFKNLYFINTGRMRISQVMSNYGFIYDFAKTTDLNNYDSTWTCGINMESGSRIQIYYKDKNNGDSASYFEIGRVVKIVSKDTVYFGTDLDSAKAFITRDGVFKYTANRGAAITARAIPDYGFIDSMVNARLAAGKYTQTIHSDVSGASNVSGSTTDLLHYDIPLTNWVTDGDCVNFSMSFFTNSTTTNRTIEILFGGSTVFTTGAVSTPPSKYVSITGKIVKTGSYWYVSSQMVSDASTFGSAFTSVLYTGFPITTVELKATGLATGTNVLGQQYLIVTKTPAN